MVVVGGFGSLISILWRRMGIDHLHYLQYDSSTWLQENSDSSPGDVLRDLIHEVKANTGNARHEARTHAKAWLIANVSFLDEEEILLAKSHLGYLLPAGWGS
jgi:hypothetical protein